MLDGIDVAELFRKVMENPSAIQPFLEKFTALDDNELFELFKHVRGTLAPKASEWV